MVIIMERIDQLELLEAFTGLADTGIRKLHNRYFDNSAFITARKRWEKYFDFLDCDTQVEYEQTVINAFCDYEGIYSDFYWTQGLLAAVQSSLNAPDPIPGLAESEEALRRSWDDFAGRLSEEQKAPFYNYVKAKKESIDSTKDCAYLHGYESAMALVSNIGIKANEDVLEKLYTKLGKGGI